MPRFLVWVVLCMTRTQCMLILAAAILILKRYIFFKHEWISVEVGNMDHRPNMYLCFLNSKMHFGRVVHNTST